MAAYKEEVRLGDFVELSAHRMGMVKYVGEIHGKKGIFYGVELWKGDGKHSGTFEGVEYFEVVNESMGVFVIPKAILYILDVPSNYDPFERVRQQKLEKEKKRKERNAKYSHLDKKNNKKKSNKTRYKSNNKQLQKPSSSSKSKKNNDSNSNSKPKQKQKSKPKPKPKP
eukprot:154736_1